VPTNWPPISGIFRTRIMGLNINNALHNYFWAVEEMSVGDGCDDSMEQLFLSENG